MWNKPHLCQLEINLPCSLCDQVFVSSVPLAFFPFSQGASLLPPGDFQKPPVFLYRKAVCLWFHLRLSPVILPVFDIVPVIQSVLNKCTLNLASYNL